MPQALNPVFVRDATCPSDRLQIDYFDSLIPGLALRIGRAGKKTWTYLYREAGKRKRMTLGNAALMSLADARNAARQANGAVANKVRSTSDGLTDSRTDPRTFDALASIFLARPGLKATTQRDYRRIIETELLPAWKGRAVASLTRDDLFKVLDKIVKRGANVLANRTQRVVVNLLGIAAERGWVQANIARGIRMVGGREMAREVTLNMSELAKFWIGLNKERSDIRDMLRLVILTAARKNEVRRMDWSELDMLNGGWMLPAARAKSGRERFIHLAPTAHAILEARNEGRDVGRRHHGLVFPNVPESLSHNMAAICSRTGIQRVTVHDLRRTAATLIAADGASRVVLKLILGHVDQDVTAIYDRHAYTLERSQALVKLDHMIRSELAMQ
jgi:integrase